MTQQATSGPGTFSAHEGEDFVCNVCGCEVMVKHWGHPRAHTEIGVFVCHCGATMEPEHPDRRTGSGMGGRAFDQDDFLGQGSGAGGPEGGV